MNAQNNMDRYFMLSQRKSRLQSRTIYSPKYFYLMLTMIILGGTYQLKYKIFSNHEFSLQDYLLQIAAIIIAFLISSFSQFIGHRILFITSFALCQIFFILVYFYRLFPSAWILFNTTRILLLQQINVQIYGMWPQNFCRIYAELLIFYEVTKQIIIIIQKEKYDEDLTCFIFFGMIVVNLIWLLFGSQKPNFKIINDFKSPETDSVFKDFLRLLRNLKIIIFTLLYIFIILSLFIFRYFMVNNFLEQRNHYSTTLLFFSFCILPILSIILLRLFVKLNLKSSFSILISLILLVALLVIWLILQEVDYFAKLDVTTFLILYFFWLITYNLQDIFMTPQYWQILLNIGIRNLDFVASYQLLAHGLAYIFYSFLIEFDNQLKTYLINNFWILILSLIGIILILSLTFYQFLGFKQYFQNTNTSQVEEDKFLIEIV